MNAVGYVSTILMCTVAYLIGSCSWGLFIGHWTRKIDVRQYYSKNAGATNVSRVLGWKWGFVVLWLDMLKVPFTFLWVFLISLINTSNWNSGDITYYWPLLFTLIGHCYPVYFKFKPSGKAVACFIGLTWMINPIYFCLFSAVFWLVFWARKTVSLSSISATITVMLCCWIPYLSGLTMSQQLTDGLVLIHSDFMWLNQARKYNLQNYTDTWWMINLVFTLGGVVLILRHKQNIVRLYKKTEPQFQFKRP